MAPRQRAREGQGARQGEPPRMLLRRRSASCSKNLRIALAPIVTRTPVALELATSWALPR